MANIANSLLLNIELTANSVGSQNTEYNINLHGGNKLITSFDKSNDNSLAKFQYRPTYNNIAEYECVTVIDVTGNTTWSYAERNRFNKTLHTKTYTEGSQVIVVANGVITLNLSQATTFFVTAGDYYPSRNNHIVTTINILKPNVPDTVSIGFNMIFANIKNVSASTWRSANVRWPDGDAPVSTHTSNTFIDCGDFDVYSFINFNNVLDYPRTNTYNIFLINPGAETGNTYGWTGNRSFTVANTTVRANANGSFSFYWNDTNPEGISGEYTGVATQRIALDVNDTILLSDIDSGKANINIGWYQKGWWYLLAPGSTGSVVLSYYDESNTRIRGAASARDNSGHPLYNQFIYRSLANTIPANTRYIDVQMESYKTSGSIFNYLRSAFDNIQPIKIERFWNEPGAVKDVANTQQNKIWYGFAPYIRKRFSWKTIHDVCFLTQNQGISAPAWFTIAAEWTKYKNYYPNRVFHFICVRTDTNDNSPYFPLPVNLHDYDDVSVPVRVHYVDTEDGDRDTPGDWFEMLGLEDEVCYGGFIRFQGRYLPLRANTENGPPPQAFPVGSEILYSPAVGGRMERLVTKCKEYNIATLGTVVASNFVADYWLYEMISDGLFGLHCRYLNDYVPTQP